jgi:hypothetical protein
MMFVKLTTLDGKDLEFVAQPVVTAKGLANHAMLNQLDVSLEPMVPVANEFPDVLPDELSGCDRTTSGRGSSTRISSSDSQRSENTINTHKYNTIYWSSSRSYYNLGSCISYTKEGWSQKCAVEDKSQFAEAISLNDQNILIALKENAIHRFSKPEDPSMEYNPHWFGLPTDNPRQHRRKDEAVPHLHTEIQQEQSLSDYAQPDLSKVTKRSPLDMQRLLKKLITHKPTTI